MTDQQQEGPGENAAPIPRDMPDQQAHGGEDPWEGRRASDDDTGQEAAPDVPDTDEAGTGRQGAPHSAAVHPDHPVPDESPA
ncbi:hypothetical protein AAW14_32825 [Streptomyces hygroscopicus]|uniref:hypothetical protein n=1 Tax=Streptomyces hygroscopicus TaxID=1912 RepID=UPI0022402DBE|nr:hypothetical protein [Streptomyces hygroscopicus]MCW7946634.1 hypothetical protein [Streptomyces hygroscopicus]